MIFVSRTEPTDSVSSCARSTRRRWLFRGMLTVGVWLSCELISWIGLTFVELSWSHVASERDSLADLQSKDGQFERKEGRFEPADEVLHPYLGFVRRPNSASEARLPFGVSEYGFPDDNTPLVVRQPMRSSSLSWGVRWRKNSLDGGGTTCANTFRRRQPFEGSVFESCGWDCRGTSNRSSCCS